MTRTQRLTLIATILGSTVVFLDATVVNVALPAIAGDLDAGLASQQWVVEAYLLALVALMLVGGSLGDQFGRRRMFVFGLIAFGATSALCAIAPSDELLIAARGLQGFAGALLVPGSLALVASAFEGAARGRAVGTWTAWTGISTILGPAGGGALVEALSWRWVFWVNLPLIAFTVWITLRSVTESRDPDAFLGIDKPGIVLSALGLGGPVFALIEQPGRGWGDPVVLIPMLGGIACFTGFLIYEARAKHPMLELSLFRIRNFAAANLATLATYAGLMGGFFFIGLFLQQTAGYTAIEAGLATTPVSVMLFFLSPRFGRLASGTGPHLPMTVGPIIAGIGMLLLMLAGPEAKFVSEILPGILVFGLGLAATVAPLTATVLDSVEERHAGIASGINNGISRVAGLLAIAILGALISASFSGGLDDRLGAAPLSPAGETAVAEVKDRTLSSFVEDGVPPREEERIRAAASEASTSAFRLGVGLAGGLMILGGLISGIGIVNPREHSRVDGIPARAATAGECGRCADEEPHREPEPVPATMASS